MFNKKLFRIVIKLHDMHALAAIVFFNSVMNQLPYARDWVSATTRINCHHDKTHFVRPSFKEKTKMYITLGAWYQ